MTELLTAAQMRAAEQTAIASGRVTGSELMERAGQGVVAAMDATWPDLAQSPQRAVVLCGPGNNGGDGFVVARLMRARGWEVEVLLFGDPARLPPDAQANFQRCRDLGPVGRTPGPVAPRPADAVLVDALFGLGLTRPLGPDCGPWVAAVTDPRAPWKARLSIDIPSGLCADSGRILTQPDPGPSPACFRADLTVTFHRAKPGHYLAEGPAVCGRLIVKDIGL